MIATLLMMAQAATTPAAYAECVSTHINADPRMVQLPAEQAERLVIHDDALKACATLRAGVPKSDVAMLDRIDASTRAVLANPEAAEVGDGELDADTPQS